MELLHYIALPEARVAPWRRGAADDNGQPTLRAATPADGDGIPCRHCLRQVPAGRAYRIAALRPFAGLNPYTECGPVFVCDAPCPDGVGGGD